MLVWLVAATSCTSGPTLVIDLVTDLEPGVEFLFVQTRIEPFEGSAGGGLSFTTRVTSGDGLSGLRVAELAGIAPGEWFVFTQLLDVRGASRGATALRLTMGESSRVMRVQITRDCIGVTCPDGGDPGAIACLGGACVDPRCPDDPTFCTPPDCAEDSDCDPLLGTPSCLGDLCVEGRCFHPVDDEVCAASAYCHPSLGCVERTATDAGPVDAGPFDSGGLDAGREDAGVSVPRLGGVVDVCASQNHFCAVLDSGEVRCSGQNTDGQLGLGTSTAEEPLRTIPGISDADEVVCGSAHTCIRSGNLLRCFGNNGDGQLGLGSAEARVLVPTVVRGGGLPDPATIQRLRAVERTTCVTVTGTAYCWGRGFGSVPNPVSFPTLGFASLPTLRAGHQCANDAMGVTFCWGDNSWGQLGDSTTVSRAEPAPVPGLTDVIELGTLWNGTPSFGSTCALRATGRVVCFGANRVGQLGDGTTMFRTVPMEVTGLPDVVELVVGHTWSCGRTGSGEVFCWGSASRAGVGIGAGDVSSPLRVELPPVARLDAADAHGTCAVTRDGEVACWGSLMGEAHTATPRWVTDP